MWAISPAISEAAIVTRIVRTTSQADESSARRVEVGAQQDIADDGAGEEPETVGQTEIAGDHLGVVGQVGAASEAAIFTVVITTITTIGVHGCSRA